MEYRGTQRLFYAHLMQEGIRLASLKRRPDMRPHIFPISEA